jgi:hypothetical protein
VSTAAKAATRTHRISRPGTSRRRRYRYLRAHKPHYYFVLSGITCASIVLVLETAAYLNRSVQLAEVAFGAVAVTTLVIFCAFFCGFYMALSGTVPIHRLKYVVPHGAVGVLAPLFYTLNISFGVEGVGREPVSAGMVLSSALCLVMLVVQFAMGKAVVHQEPLHLVK